MLFGWEAVHLFVHSKQLQGGWGGGVKLQVRNHQYWRFQKQHRTCLFWPRRAEAHVVVVSSAVLSARGGGACMAECIRRLNILHGDPQPAVACLSLSICLSVCDQPSSPTRFFKGSGQPKQNHSSVNTHYFTFEGVGFTSLSVCCCLHTACTHKSSLTFGVNSRFLI